MAKVLSNQISSEGSPYAYYTVYATVTSRTPTRATISWQVDTSLQYSSSWVGTGKTITGWLRGSSTTIKYSSEYWSGTGTYTAYGSVTVGVNPSDTSIPINFAVTGGACTLSETSCSSLSINSIESDTSNCEITKSNVTQSSAKVTLSNLPNCSGSYGREIRWYIGNALLGTTSDATGTSANYTFNGLLPNTNYNLKVKIYSIETVGENTVTTFITDKSISVTTTAETGTLTTTASTTYLNVNVSSMSAGPSYTRTIDVYYKRSTDWSYTKYTTMYSQLSSASTQITGLVSGATYNVYCVIKNGSTTLKTTNTTTTTTTTDTSLVPMPRLNSVTQLIGSLNVVIEWMTNKQVSGTSYAIMAKVGSGDWTTLQTVTSVRSPITETITLPSGSHQEYTDFKIVATNSALAVQSNTSNLIEDYLIRDTFEWTTNKVQGQSLVISAEEWNRLRDYVVAKNEVAGYHISIPIVSTGDRITANIYNAMKAAISNVNLVPYEDRVPGDEITADCINALRTAINS